MISTIFQEILSLIDRDKYDFILSEEDHSNVYFMNFFKLPNDFEDFLLFRQKLYYTEYVSYCVFEQESIKLNIDHVIEILNFFDNIIKTRIVRNLQFLDKSSSVLFMLILSDTKQFHKIIKNNSYIYDKYRKSLKFYVESLNEEDKKIILKYYNPSGYYVNKSKNKKFFLKILKYKIIFENSLKKLYFEVLEKRYAPNGSGYFEAMNNFNNNQKSKYSS